MPLRGDRYAELPPALDGTRRRNAAFAGVAYPRVAVGRYAGGTMEQPIVDCNRRYTLEEYFALDGGSEVRYPCKVGGPDLRVRSPRSGRYHCPDVSVTCGPRVFAPPQSRSTVANPQVLVEVLSKSTADEDRGEKFR